MQTFDRNNVEALLTEVVRKRGEGYRYGIDSNTIGCSYQKNGEPSCGIGLMLSDIGVPLRILKKMDRCSNSNINEPVMLSILEDNGFTFTEGAVNFMTAFQRWQDQSAPYSRCIEMAKAGNAEPYGHDAGEPPF